MKTKYFMRGLGTGLIVATLILCMIYAYKMSDSQIISRAKELGMVYEKENDAPIIPDEEEADKGEEGSSSSEEQSKEAQSAETQTGENSTSSEPQSQENNTPSNEEQQSTEPQSVEQGTTNTPYVTVTIDGGMNSIEVSTMLKNLGVISDIDSFDYYLVKNGYSKNLQPGEHELLKGANYEELAYILTHRQK